MDEWLSHPAVQSGVAPFALALVAAILLRRSRWQGIAPGVAFAVAVALTVGFSFETLTAARKLMIIGIGAVVLDAALPLRTGRAWPIRLAIAALAGAAAVWMLWRILLQSDAGAAVFHAAGAAAYAALAAASTVPAEAADEPIAASASSLAFGLGSGLLALFGASALLAQWGIAVAAGAAALLLMQVVARPAPYAPALALPAAVIASMIGLLSVFSGTLSWVCLLPLLAVPWAPRVAGRVNARWLRALAGSIAASLPVVIAASLAWSAAAT